MASIRHPRRFVFDACLHVAIDGVDEVAAVVLRVEAEDGAAEHPVEELRAPRTDAERLGVRPRNVPERDDGGFRQAIVDVARHQGEVVILHEDDRVFGARLGTDRGGKALVHFDVLLPVAGAEHGPHVRDVTQRPQPFVREAVVIAALLLLGEPDAAQRVRGLAGRHLDVVVPIDGLLVRGAVAMRDPRAGAGAHDRLHRGDQATRRAADRDLIALPHVDVRLAIGYEQDLVAGELVAQHRAQHFGTPRRAALEVAAAAVDFAQQRPHLADQRLQVRVRRLAKGLDQPLAAQQRAHPGHPAAPRQVGDEHGDQRHQHAEQDEEADDVLAGIGAAPVDEAHVVHQHERAGLRPAGGQREPCHV
jgi:hypothetical protein